MSGVVIGALMALGMVQQTDTVMPVGDAKLLDVETVAGSVVVGTWERDEIRIQADHSRRTFVEIDRRRSRISVEAGARRGPANVVDYQITVPAALNLKIEGMMADITVEGARGEVEAETLDGDVIVRGGRGSIKVSSMSGSVLVEGAEGLIDVESAARDVRIVDSSGEVVGETMGGDLIMEGLRASSVDVGSLGGVIWYDGTLEAGGTYFFGSHGGAVTLVVPEGASAQFDISTVYGPVFNNLSGEMERSEPGERHRLEVGGGDAVVEVETFGGRINVVRKGTEGEVPRGGHHEGEMSGLTDLALDLALDLDGLDGILSGVTTGVSSGLARALSGIEALDGDRPRDRHRRRPGGGR